MSESVIMYGSRGALVEEVQRALVGMGLLGGAGVDGVFGTRTRHAVITFQGQAGIDVDGVVGPDTWAALELEELGEVPPASECRADSVDLVHFTEPGEPTPPPVTSPWGHRRDPISGEEQFHNATDYGRKRGRRFYASADGVVETVWSGNPWNGNGVRVRVYECGAPTRYRFTNIHMDRVDVGVGDSVAVGEVLGLVGATGRVTGPHEHYMIEVLDSSGVWRSIDPESVVIHRAAAA